MIIICYNRAMLGLVALLLGPLCRLWCSRRDLLLENLALRQQLAVLKRRHKRPRLNAWDRLFWITLRKLWHRWKQPLVTVTPKTVTAWHQAGFRWYWSWLSRPKNTLGRKPVGKPIRDLILQMATENSTWGAPRIHGELLKLGFAISERTISRWLQRVPRNPKAARLWKAFLQNHREAIAAMDFFTVPTLTFGVLYCFFVIAHDRRRILHFNVTQHPTSCWVTQQLREAFPYDLNHKYLIFDRDTKFDETVSDVVKAIGLKAVRTSFKSPWQNGVAERWVGSCRRDLLDHVIVVNERHLKRLLSEYTRYFHQDRAHLGLEKDTPDTRPPAKSNRQSTVISFPRLGGLHHAL